MVQKDKRIKWFSTNRRIKTRNRPTDFRFPYNMEISFPIAAFRQSANSKIGELQIWSIIQPNEWLGNRSTVFWGIGQLVCGNRSTGLLTIGQLVFGNRSTGCWESVNCFFDNRSTVLWKSVNWFVKIGQLLFGKSLNWFVKIGQLVFWKWVNCFLKIGQLVFENRSTGFLKIGQLFLGLSTFVPYPASHNGSVVAVGCDLFYGGYDETYPLHNPSIRDNLNWDIMMLIY